MNFKDTLNLPKTDFPMKAGLVQREPEMLKRWESEDLYGQVRKIREGSAKFVLHDGPPFANGDVHVGTALNKILKDIIVKHKTMCGFDAPYVPGWDCHGLPIEYAVVKNDAKLTPVQVREKSEQFARKYIDIQRTQFKRLGVLADWEKPYLTLDKQYEADVLRVFADMVAQEMVYRGKKPVYWSTGCQTALAEAEVEYVDKTSPAIFVKFDVIDSSPKTSVVIWTTTPWTLPANLAVAINPKLPYSVYQHGEQRIILCDTIPDSSFEKLKMERKPLQRVEGQAFLNYRLQHPFVDRVVPVLAGDFVAADTGTGCVHIAPGHGQDDYLLAKHLGLLSPVDDAGKFTEECGVAEFVGKYVFSANADVIELLRFKRMLLAEESIQHSYPHCWRSKTPVIFRAVDQWFIRLEKLRADALQAIQKVRWIPSWGENRIRGTVETRPDWCISRQRSWGVPLPVFYKPNGEAILDKELIEKVAALVEKRGSNVWFELDADLLAKELGLPAGLTKGRDTLDVWIESGSSHRAVLRKHPELKFPADIYLEGSDQHRGWFQTSLLSSVATNGGQAPFSTVLTHGFLVDLDGKKISKSSSYEKPKDADSFVNKYGADILRLWVASENYQNDIPLSEEIFTRIGDTYRSIRNTLRILLGNLNDFNPEQDRVDLSAPVGPSDDTAVDRWMLSQLQLLIAEVREAYESYEFHKVYHAINTFCAVEISSLYVDITKDRMYCDEPASPRRRYTQSVMHEMASVLCRLVAPILSFTADEAWSFLTSSGKSIHLQLMPESKEQWRDARLESHFGRLLKLREIASAELEKARQSKAIGKSIEARLVLELSDGEEFKRLQGIEAQLAEFFIVSQVELRAGKETAVSLSTPQGKKCARSWKWDLTVGQDSEFPDVTARDARALRSFLSKSSS